MKNRCVFGFLSGPFYLKYGLLSKIWLISDQFFPLGKPELVGLTTDVFNITREKWFWPPHTSGGIESDMGTVILIQR